MLPGGWDFPSQPGKEREGKREGREGKKAKGIREGIFEENLEENKGSEFKGKYN